MTIEVVDRTLVASIGTTTKFNQTSTLSDSPPANSGTSVTGLATVYGTKLA